MQNENIFLVEKETEENLVWVDGCTSKAQQEVLADLKMPKCYWFENFRPPQNPSVLMTIVTFLPTSGGEREPQHRRVRLDPLRLLLAHRLRHPPLQSLRAHQGSQWSYSRSCFIFMVEEWVMVSKTAESILANIVYIPRL